jgi:hypothetical protein
VLPKVFTHPVCSSASHILVASLLRDHDSD